MKKIDRQTEIWAERHRLEGHHPYPAPTLENPERWECKCDPNASWIAVCRTLTAEQTRQKFRAPWPCRQGPQGGSTAT
jgi:hypothetical protein